MPPAPLLFILGTRSEAIKALPVIQALAERHPSLPVRAGATGQHSMLFDQIADIEGLKTAWNLEVMSPRRQLPLLLGRLVSKLENPIRHADPAGIVIAGDSASTLASSIVAHMAQVPFAHLEAGLRGEAPGQPYPEQTFRKMISAAAALHLAPTQSARDNLLAEGAAPQSIHVAGEPGLDSFAEKLRASPTLDDPELADIDWSRPIALATMVRRENHQDGAYGVCHALAQLAQDVPDLQIIFANHLNPHLMEPVRNLLSGKQRIRITLPLPRQVFVNLLRRARVVITDSGGVHEEASALGIPIVSLRAAPDGGRDIGECPVYQAGNQAEAIVEMAKQALGAPRDPDREARFLDSHRPAAPRIADRLAQWLEDLRSRGSLGENANG